MQTEHAAVLILLLLAACYVAGGKSEQAVMQDTTAFESRPVPATPFDGLNMTCFKLCQLGRLSEVPAAAQHETAAANRPSTTTSGTQQPSKQEPRQSAGTRGSSASPAGQSASISTPPGSARRLLAGTANITANSTANSTASSTSSSSAPSTSLAPVTSCAGLDSQDVALLRSRYRAFRTNLALSDFSEIFYSIGNLWYAIDELLKQAVNSLAQGRIEVNAESVLLLNANIAGIMAFWGNLVQNILLLKADLTLPLPDEGPSSG